ncbi:DUF1320 domain-containing protein [Tenacibaculum haliotis]|uniref:DUF1320 domain-containing protein n=1 Tax=Tenacibaculum haliotis TaxID=1888914 RepID=UPI0021AED49E|nr:DUF1320 domain-containing protein [Tenacibaculum haliotis]MCT4698465.1 DUF1320 domain-containing protein [Tenacibaculum haliotis]
MFITDNDYTVLVRDEVKGILLEDYSDTKLRGAEQMALAQIRNYLAGKYNVNEIFNQVDDQRNSHIVMIVIDCALYHLYTSTVPRSMPDIRSARYQDAIDWLKLVASGDTLADLPKITDESGEELIGIKVTSKYSPENQRW